MDDRLTIYVDRLRSGATEAVKLSTSPSFLEVSEDNLKFEFPVQIEGKAYLTEDHLILHFDMETKASIPCKRCNKVGLVPIKIKGFYHTVPLVEIRDHAFDMTTILRDEILLEVPPFYSCEEGECEDIETIKKYFKSENQKDKDDHTYHPFADLK